MTDLEVYEAALETLQTVRLPAAKNALVQYLPSCVPNDAYNRRKDQIFRVDVIASNIVYLQKRIASLKDE